MQSHAGEIGFLPALPAAWPDGSATGLVARGAVELDVYWQSGKASRVVLRPRVDGVQTLRAPRGQTIASVSFHEKTANNKSLGLTGGETVRTNLEAGKEYTVLFR